jgi:hypothetical protein
VYRVKKLKKSRQGSKEKRIVWVISFAASECCTK